MRIAVLGMGRMGRALAARLLAGGHAVSVWNRSPGKAAELVAAGALEATTLSEVVEGAEVAITILADDAAVREVALGDKDRGVKGTWDGDGGGTGDALGSLHASLGHATVFVDSSTISPQLSGELARAFGLFVTMPILGRPEAVRSGTAAYLVGGESLAVARLEPMLASLADPAPPAGRPPRAVRRYTAAPLASAAKLTSNLLLLSGLVALAESIALGRAGGLTDEQLRDLLADSPMLAPGLANRFEGVLGESQEAWWTTLLGAKDLRLAIAVVEEHAGSLPAAHAILERYEAAAAAGLGAADIAAVSRLYRTGDQAPHQ